MDTIEELRSKIAALEDMVPRFDVSLEEIGDYPMPVVTKVRVLGDRSEISSPAAVLLAALIIELREELKGRECEISRAAGGKCVC